MLASSRLTGVSTSPLRSATVSEWPDPSAERTVTLLFTDIEGSTKLLHELGAERYSQRWPSIAASCERRSARRRCRDRYSGGRVLRRVSVRAGRGGGSAGSPERPFGPGTDRHPHRDAAHHRGGLRRLGRQRRRGSPPPARRPGARLRCDRRVRRDRGLRDLGEHRLKDLSAPERIYQLGDGDFPPLRTLYRTNLPVPATPFLGRQRELAEIGAAQRGRTSRW